MKKDELDILLEELEEVKKECSVPKWNGYEALPIPKKSFYYVKAFLKLFYQFFKDSPELSPLPNGRMGLEWNKDDSSLLLSINKKGILYWTALMGEEGEEKVKMQGRIDFESFKSLIKILKEFEEDIKIGVFTDFEKTKKMMEKGITNVSKEAFDDIANQDKEFIDNLYKIDKKREYYEET